MKILTILGTRPEIIRLSRIIPKLDANCDHVVLHTGQNHDHELSQVFFEELGIRKPDEFLGLNGKTSLQRVGEILSGCEEAMLRLKPDRILILGDTDSGMAAFTASRLGIPVFHMEAGNRCFDNRVPEETNRRAIDHSSNILLPYTENSRQNLLREGISSNRIYITGNPIHEVIRGMALKIDSSKALDTLNLKKKGYFLATFHRAENVDVPYRLKNIVASLDDLAKAYMVPIVVSCHPRTRAKLSELNIELPDTLKFLKPFGFIDFLSLQKHALCVLSDSGTVQEECAILKVPNVTLRDVTERPETLDVGSNFIAGVDPLSIARAVKYCLSEDSEWRAPQEYLVENVSSIVSRILLGHFEGLKAQM
ncbi:non-hydrolyzing UDP-N-acetylglucosamine 2-epimerase [Kordiimonas sp.]|uniref:non-hydrolyzing UDP-N-acetylglucosamine 2-epimerase n=1 Tax=Kordiimonas sp. TaxID=1970157 RepID=UPI003B52639D